MHRMWKLAARVAPIALALGLTAFAAPAGATSTTSVAISSAAVSGTTISVSGAIALGDDALAPSVVVTDGAGDDPSGGRAPNGLDLKSGSIQYVPASKALKFTVTVYNPPPSGSPTPGAPAYVYDWQISTDGTDNNQFLSAGAIGTNFPPRTGPGYALCSNSSAGWDCSQSISGTWAGDTITMTVPLTKIQAKPGSVIGTGATLGSAPTLTSTLNPSIELFYDTGGDDAQASDYTIPGGVQLAVVPSGTPVDAIDPEAFSPATVAKDGTYKASLAKPGKAGNYDVVALSCFGNMDAPTCTSAVSTITV